MVAHETGTSSSTGTSSTEASSTVETAAFWDELYGARDQVWSGRVNPVLAEVAAELTPGSALDLGCGEGGDAIWLARRGWAVTGVDVSATALGRAMAHAAGEGVAERISWAAHDLERSLPDGPFDLVSAQFFQSPIAFARADTLRRAAALVAPGGSLLLVSHAAMPAWSNHHHDDRVLPTPASELADLGLPADGWDVVRAETAERPGTGPDGQHGTLVDCVVWVRRHPS